MPLWLDRFFLDAVDAVYALPPARRPTREQLATCRIISHRGERDNRRVFENTCAAFDPLRGSGVYGIEFDVRWTKDLVPVVFHDADLKRLFSDSARIVDLSWNELHQRRPEIPDLLGFVRRFEVEFHLMVELKDEPYPDPALQNRRLIEALGPALERGRCHVMSLKPEMFGWLPGIPSAGTLGVARLNTGAISDEALASNRGGMAAQYLALTDAQVRRHHARNQRVGSGFPRSRSVLYREIRRGVDYVFSNQALQMELWRREALSA